MTRETVQHNEDGAGLAGVFESLPVNDRRHLVLATKAREAAAIIKNDVLDHKWKLLILAPNLIQIPTFGLITSLTWSAYIATLFLPQSRDARGKLRKLFNKEAGILDMTDYAGYMRIDRTGPDDFSIRLNKVGLYKSLGREMLMDIVRIRRSRKKETGQNFDHTMP